jgi:ParB family transcriptional regulator, chromosome partitioning protein
MTDKKVERRGLGRGLSALMADIQPAVASGAAARGEQLVALDRLFPNPDQPRRDFAPEALDDLAASIRQKGVIQPLIVRAHPSKEGFEIVAGERRWRAAQLAGLHRLPVLVRDFDDAEVIEVAIIENIQRADLNAVEEALAYRQLMEKFGHTQERLADALAKSRSHIANTLRLLNLPDDVLLLLRTGRLTAGHARALVPSPKASELARAVVAKGLSVRETERLVSARVVDPSVSSALNRRGPKDADTIAIENDLSANLGMLVNIHQGPAGEGGALTIRYRDLDQLDLLCEILSRVDINDIAT